MRASLHTSESLAAEAVGAPGSVPIASLAPIATNKLLGRDTAGTGPVEVLSVVPTECVPAFTGDVTNTAGTLALAIGASTVTTAMIQNSAVTTTKLAVSAVTGSKIASNAVSNAKLDAMADATIKGRQLGGGAGDAEDLTPTQARAVLNVADGANNYVHPNHSGDVTSTGDGATVIGASKVVSGMIATSAVTSTKIGTGAVTGAKIASNAVSNAKMDAMAANTFKAEGTGSAADPQDIAVSASQWVGRTATSSLGPNTMASLLAELMASLAGTSFPGSPADGQPFYRTDHDCAYHYSSTASGWLSDAVHEIEGGDAAAMATSIYYRLYSLGATAPRYTASYGWFFGFDVKCVGLTIFTAITPAASAAVQVMDNGSAVTGASLTISTPATSAQDETLMSNTITAGHAVALQNDATGATLGASTVRARFRRFAT